MKITSTNQSDPVADSQDGKLSDWTGFVHVDGFNVSYGETDDATDSWSEVQFTPDDSDIGEDVLPVVDEVSLSYNALLVLLKLSRSLAMQVRLMSSTR